MDDQPAKNRSAQARYRDRHAIRLATCRKVAAILARSSYRDEDLERLADHLHALLDAASIRKLRAWLGDARRNKRNEKFLKANEARWHELWLSEHPGRTVKDYNKMIDSDEMNAWRKAHGAAAIAAEKAAWERDHPGEDYPELECALPEVDYLKLLRWCARREKREAAP